MSPITWASAAWTATLSSSPCECPWSSPPCLPAHMLMLLVVKSGSWGPSLDSFICHRHQSCFVKFCWFLRSLEMTACHFLLKFIHLRGQTSTRTQGLFLNLLYSKLKSSSCKRRLAGNVRFGGLPCALGRFPTAARVRVTMAQHLTSNVKEWYCHHTAKFARK